MANTNPMIKFLRGTQTNFDAIGVADSGKVYEDGVFYLTTDTNRLYVGNGDQTPALLNQTVQVVDDVASLPASPPAHENDFYYCTAENILAVYDGSKWVQINHDTQNKSVAIGATVSGKVATITSTVTDKAAKSDTMTITAGDNVSLSADASGNLTISSTNTDTSTTEAGHYTPADEDETLGTESGKVIHQIKVDSKKHVIEVVERNENRNDTVALGATNDTTANKVTVTSSVKDAYATKSGSMNISGAGATTVSAESGNIIISSTDTDTKVTAEANHYDPTENTNSALSAANKIITAINRDSKGHVVSLDTASSQADVTKSVAAVTDGASVTTTVKDVLGNSDADAVQLIAGTAVTITADAANKKITIASSDTDTKVTSVGNHYAPTADASAALTVGANKFATGVSRDAKGHVTAITGASSLEDVAVAVTGGTNTATVTTTAKNLFGTADSDAFNVVGAGATTISGDATTKKITVTSTDRSVTDAAYHYDPSEDTGSVLDATNKLITKVHRDSKGHVTGITTGDSAEDFTMAAQAITDGATITGTAKNIAGTAKSGSVTVKGDGATTVKVDDDKNVIVSSTDRSVTEVGYHYTPTKSGTLSAANGTTTSAKATTQVITGIEKDAAGHITGIVSKGIADTHNALTSVDLTVASEKLNLSVATTDGSKADAIALDIYYGEDSDTIAQLAQNGSTNAGKWNLDVYTTDEVDAKISAAVGANGAVQVVGTVNSGNALPTSNIKTGDTYIVTEKGTYNGQAATSGDMFIASADHTSGTVASDFWYYIPAGNEAVQLTSRTNGFNLQEGNSATVVGAVEFAAYDSSNTDFQVVAAVTNAASGGYNKTSVSFNMYWGTF